MEQPVMPADGPSAPSDDQRIAALREPATYLAATLEGDVVMKGGVTSGIVYPLAVCELATRYRFRNIGGTSAGAIAAAATAAAEYGRRRQRGDGYAEIGRLPATLAQSDTLFKLFQPEPPTRPLFEILVAATDARRGGPLLVAWTAVRWLKRWALAGALAGLATLAAAALLIAPAMSSSLAGSAAAIVLVAIGLALTVAGAVVGAGVGLLRRSLRDLPANFYGICTGFGDRPRGGVWALTIWLDRLLNRLADLDEDGPPLTFGDLWGLDAALRAQPAEWKRAADAALEDPERRAINLEMVTTCLTQGRPYRFPLDVETFYFHEGELRRLFRGAVVDWMKAHPANPDQAGKYEALGLRQLPCAADLPVVVAARMSLSVPPLISAIPLYAVDYGMRGQDGADPPPEVCWFSDGGISSNFPVHFFDSPLPRRPTFALNLREEHPLYPVVPGDPCAAGNLYLTRTNRQGRDGIWHRIDPEERSVASADPAARRQVRRHPASFLGAILHTMQNWSDNARVVMPGSRDRIAHVSLASDEGGMNLRMPADVVDDLSRRGRCAGEALRRRFETPTGDPAMPTMTWDNHRWIRLRASFASLQPHLAALRAGYGAAPPDHFRSYAELLADPPSRRWSGPQGARARIVIDGLCALVVAWAQNDPQFGRDAPRPVSLLRLVPRF